MVAIQTGTEYNTMTEQVKNPNCQLATYKRRREVEPRTTCLRELNSGTSDSESGALTTRPRYLLPELLKIWMVLYTADNLPSKRTSALQKLTVDSTKNNCGLVYAESTYTYESYRPSLLKFNDFAMEATLRLISFMWKQLLFFVV